MKNSKILLLACAASYVGQTKAQQVVGAGGSYNDAGNASMAFTIGEVVVANTQADNYQFHLGFHQVSLLNPLPVTIVNFNAQNKGNIHLINWATKMELNNSYFVIEHRLDGQADFKVLTTIASKAENGNSFYDLNYSYANKMFGLGNNYYRLKQVDRDGEFSYSSVQLIKVDQLQDVVASIYPNPVLTDATFVSAKSGTFTLKVINSLGQVVKTLKTASKHTVLPLANLSAGAYTLSYRSEQGFQIIKFIKQ